MRQLVMVGQYLDVLVQARGAFSADEALRVIELKTSKYTVEGPLHLGAAIGGADAAVRTALSGYGLPLGEAFQLRDDILGVFGDPARTGKPAGDDLREGKQTLLTALAMRRATRRQAALLRNGIGDRALDPDQVAAAAHRHHRHRRPGRGRADDRRAHRAGVARARLPCHPARRPRRPRRPGRRRGAARHLNPAAPRTAAGAAT